jgi:gamma-glutamyltranspeptidase/glutathione hydrolase
MPELRCLTALVLTLAAASEAAQPVRARRAMVVTRETHATRIGVEILRSGGNAVDAAVAVGLALAVTHPAAGNLGGGGFMLVRLADGATNFLDFRERAPAAATRDMYLDSSGNQTQDSRTGYRAAGVPGTARGLEVAWKKYGRKKWSELVTPAVQLAAKGFPVSWGLAQSLRGHADLFNRFPESRRIFLKEGVFYEPGEIFIQPDLARTLERIRKSGSAGFYEGETARLLSADMRANGGLITEQDLKE